jgi:hypothetical protein
MSAHLSRLRLFHQRHLRSLGWVWVWVWVWIHSHTPPRTRSPSSRHPPFTHYPFPLRSLVCGGQPSPHKPRLVVSHITCPPLSSSPHTHSFVLGTVVMNTHAGGDHCHGPQRAALSGLWSIPSTWSGPQPLLVTYNLSVRILPLYDAATLNDTTRNDATHDVPRDARRRTPPTTHARSTCSQTRGLSALSVCFIPKYQTCIIQL